MVEASGAHYVQPGRAERLQRDQLLRRLRDRIRSEWPEHRALRDWISTRLLLAVFLRAADDENTRLPGTAGIQAIDQPHRAERVRFECAHRGSVCLWGERDPR